MKPNFSIRFSKQKLPFQNLVIEYRIPITLNASQFDDYHFVWYVKKYLSYLVFSKPFSLSAPSRRIVVFGSLFPILFCFLLICNILFLSLP